MLDKAAPVVLFASKPALDELWALTVRVEQLKFDGISTTQPRILKCRETIFTEPDVIASPSTDLYDCFNIIMSQTKLKTGRLQTRMKNNQLQVSKPFRVTPALYQACLKYTMLARLAPLWNQAGDWLIQGRDFLSHTGYASAISLELVANTEELYISARATLLRLNPLRLPDLNLSALETQSLLYNASGRAGEVAVPGFWCHVLPSMKKGRLCNVSLSIPADSPFTSYRDLKRHWKNTYGYRLPETDDDIFYCQISFWGTGGKQFTYPSLCLRAGPLQSVPRVEPRPILSAFLQDLHAKMPSVCGQQVRFQPQIRHAYPALYHASQEVKGPAPNLGKRSSAGLPTAPLRHVQTMSHLTSQSQTTPSDVAKLRSSVLSMAQGTPGDASQSFQTSFSRAADQAPLAEKLRMKMMASMQNPAQPSERPAYTSSQKTGKDMGSRQEDLQPDPTTKQTSTLWNGVSKLVESGDNGHCSSQDSIQSVPNVPSVHSAQRRPDVYGPPLQCTSGAQQSETSHILTGQQALNFENRAASAGTPTALAQARNPEVTSTVSNANPPRLVPVFKPKGTSGKKNTGKDSQSHTVQSNSSNRVVPTFKPKAVKSAASDHSRQAPPPSKQRVDQKHESKEMTESFLSCSEVTSSSETSSGSLCRQRQKTPLLQTPIARANPQGKTPVAGKLKAKMLESATSKYDTTDGGSPHCQTGPLSGAAMSLGLPSTLQGKRKAEGLTETEETKKARSKPQVQDVDVEMLAKTNQLNKANTVTLAAWLKSKGVHCKSKDKKGELVERVKVLLALTGAES